MRLPHGRGAKTKQRFPQWYNPWCYRTLGFVWRQWYPNGTPKPKSLSGYFHAFPYLRWSLDVFGLFMSTFSIRYVQEASNIGLGFCSRFCMLSFPKSHHNHFYTFDGERWCFLPISSHFQTVSIDYGYPLYTPFPLIPYCVYCMHGTWFYHPLPLVLHPYYCIASCCYCLSAFNSP